LEQWSAAGERISVSNLWEKAPFPQKLKEKPRNTERFMSGAAFIGDMRS
jgi:hypothetical protein